MKHLNTAVSYFDNVYSSTPSCMVSLLEWVTTDLYKKEIEKLRKIKSKAQRDYEKRILPAITPSGVFEPKRHIDCLCQHSGIISIDIDRKENKALCTDIDKLKTRLSNIPEVAFCGLSASGEGLYVLIPIEEPIAHTLYFKILKKYFFKAWGVVIDKGCGDVTRLRGISYDSDYYLNNDASVFNTIPDSEYTKDEKEFLEYRNSNAPSAELSRILTPVFANEIDITQTRDDWFKLCSVIVNTSGEAGRITFHCLSSFNPKYNRKECDAMYDDLLKRPPYNYGLGTMVHIVKQYV